MLVKYYGLVSSDGNKQLSPRSSFLSDGLFRITQPKYLNDQGSEAKLYPYFNEFSPSDIAWAKKQDEIIQCDPFYTPTTKELINDHLRPTGSRYGENLFELINTPEGIDSIEQYDNHSFNSFVKEINDFLLESLSSQVGVLSLCKSDINELMWVHYASEGKGIAISFKEDHQFFKKFPPKSVNYKEEERASITYFEGNWRVNGEPIGTYQVSDFSEPYEIYKQLLSKGVNIKDLTERLMFSKAPKWHYEEEMRIICPLQACEKKSGEIIKPLKEFDTTLELPSLLQNYSEISLKKIPFDAFDSIILGYAICDSDREEIIRNITANPLLSHLKLKIAQYNLYGDLETLELKM